MPSCVALKDRTVGYKSMVMNKEIARYFDEIYFLKDSGELKKVENVFSTRDYNHVFYDMHHGIKYTIYEKYKEYFMAKGIKQKLFILRKKCHQHLEIHPYIMSEVEFLKTYNIEKSKLLLPCELCADEVKDFYKNLQTKNSACTDCLLKEKGTYFCDGCKEVTYG